MKLWNIQTVIKVTLLATVFFVSDRVGAQDRTSSFSFKKLTNSLCETAKSDQLFHFKYKLKKAKENVWSIYPDVKCSGKSLLLIATENQAYSVISYLKLKANPENISPNQLANQIK